MSIYVGKVSSKKIAGKIGEESEKLGGLLKKIKKPVSSLSAKSKKLVKKFLPKKRYRKFEVVDIEELAKKQGLKPNLQLFAEEAINELNFSNKALEHMKNPARRVPVQILQEAIRKNNAFPDPRGSSATMYYTKVCINQKYYNLEVLYDKASNTIYHFEYARKAMGNLPAIV